MTGFLSGRRVFSPLSVIAHALPLLFAALGAAAQEPPPSSAPLRVIELTGQITQAAVPKVRAAFESIDPARFPAGAVVLLDSQGGDGLAAIEIGRMVRAARAHVFVRGRCASACVYILAGGVVRGVPRDGAIGIHRPRLTTFVKGLGVVDVNAASNPNAAAALAAGNRQSQAYFSEMGLPDAFFAAMMAAPSDQTRYLDLAELPPLGLVGFDPAYLAERAKAAAAFYRVSEGEYAQRTLEMPQKCLAGKSLPQEVARCYRRVLRTGE